jgi:hypothetical protein
MKWRAFLAMDVVISAGATIALWLYADQVPDFALADLLSSSAEWLAEFRAPDLR